MFNEKLSEIPFSFFSEKTSELTLKYQKKNLAEISDLYHVWNDLYDALTSKYPDSDVLDILTIETSANIDASIFLAVDGYYRQAITLLRCWLETSLYCLYFNDHEVEFDKWSLGVLRPKQMSMPKNIDDLLKYLFQFGRFSKFDDIFEKRSKEKKIVLKFKTFREWINELYNELSAYVHGRGLYRSSLASISMRGKFHCYNKDTFLLWKKFFEYVLQISIIAHLLYDPKLLNRFTKRRKRVLDTLPDKLKKILIQEFDVKY